MLRNLSLSLVILAIAAVPAVSSASMMQYKGTGLTENVKIHAEGALANNRLVKAGQLRVQWEGEDYLGYCVDINQWVGTTEVTPVSYDTLAGGEFAAYLFETYSMQASDRTTAAALGVAIWEVVNETSGTYDVDDGYFRISRNARVSSAANAMLASMPDSYDPVIDPIVLSSETHQDVMVHGFNEIPEPATMALITLGSTLLLRRRRAA